ncbi:endonuclease domain-containing protein [Oceanicaulis sp. UBA6590]|uniref:endonuclease domain-containing protein n=1 Tax=Oceanicaulis sp. UBA6590 TaxID=1947008 RepID=UPI0025D3EAAF|nr:endonuclease domain-containing protein [Oceanicaulis sp. UBA6590]
MASKKPITTARRLRRDMTDAERKLWSMLRRRPDGLKFRRQHPISRYVADFACPQIGLIIELDGGQHNLPAHRRRDEHRTRCLENQGWHVLRFWNTQVFEAPDMLGDQILDLVHALKQRRQNPSPPWPRGRGRVRGCASIWEA